MKVRDKDTAYFLRSLKQKLIKDATPANQKFRLQIDLPTVEKFGSDFPNVVSLCCNRFVYAQVLQN